MIFAREISDPLTGLVKKIDEATEKNKAAKMRSFVVFLSDDEGLEKKLKEFADEEKIKHTILTIDKPSGPRSYKLSKDADVIVVFYVKKEAKVNYAFKEGELKAADLDKILADLPKVLSEPEKKDTEKPKKDTEKPKKDTEKPKK